MNVRSHFDTTVTRTVLKSLSRMLFHNTRPSVQPSVTEHGVSTCLSITLFLPDNWSLVDKIRKIFSSAYLPNDRVLSNHILAELN